MVAQSKKHTPRRIAFAGSATNPSHLEHTHVLSFILQCQEFDLVIWYPSGFSDLKPTLIDGMHRQQMAYLAFPKKWVYRPLPGWSPLLLDFSATTQRDIPTAERFRLLRQNYPGADLTFVTGSDAVTPEADGRFPIEKWVTPELLTEEDIAIIPRQGFALAGEALLPWKLRWLTLEAFPDVSSSDIRRMIAQDDPQWKSLVNPKVRDYILLHNLYQEEN